MPYPTFKNDKMPLSPYKEGRKKEMDIKNVYHSMEDKWYALLDKVETKIPVYSVIDKIDKVVPSFSIFIVLVLLVLGAGIFSLLGGGSTSAVFTFKDSQGGAVPNISVHFSYHETEKNLTTNSVGNVVLENIPIGTNVTITALLDGHKGINETKKIESDKPIVFQFELLPDGERKITLQFIDDSGQSVSGKTIQATLSCLNSGVSFNPSTYTVTNGILTIIPPIDCGGIILNANGNGFEKLEGFLVSPSNTVVSLQAEEIEYGKIKVAVTDSENNQFIENMDVQLFNENGVQEQTLSTNVFGVAVFQNIKVGKYYASASDPAGDYALETSETITVTPNQQTTIEIMLSKSVKATLNVTVQDKASKQKLGNATVKLVRKIDSKLIQTKLTSATGEPAVITIGELAEYELYATLDGYLGEKVLFGNISGSQTITIELEKLTAQNSGKVTVAVSDEDGLPVDNAQVIMYEASSGFIAHSVNPKITDFNGMASFIGVPESSYFARVVKYPAGPSDSPTFSNQKSIPTYVTVTLKIGVGNVSVIVKDIDGFPIPFSSVEFLTDGSDECPPKKCQIQTDAQGKATRSFKADRKVFVKASAAGYTPTISLSQQLFPNEIITISIPLEKTILGKEPIIQLVEMKDLATGLPATELKAGKAYESIFVLKIPTALSNEEAGVHIRVGEEAILENDTLQITATNAPQSQITKGTAYHPPNGFNETDQYHITNGYFKWANLVWNDGLESGVYYASATIRINSNAGPLVPLSIHYRAWAENEENEFIRSPEDSTLGKSQSTAQKGELYAETFQSLYFNGKPIECDETFCFSGEQFLNQTDELLVEGPPYNAIVNKQYAYSFVLTNNAEKIYSNPKLRLFVSSDGINSTEEITLNAYKIIGTSGQPITSSGLTTNDIPGGEGNGISIGEMNPYQTVSGTFDMLAEQTGSTALIIQFISEGEVIFTRSVSVGITGKESLSFTVDPNTASAFIPTTFTIHVQDSKGFDLQDAMVTLVKVDPSKNRQTIAQKTTGITGKVSIIAPGSLPRTHFIFDASKPNYSSTPITIVVDENVGVFDPKEMDFKLPATPNAEQFKPLKITNNTQIPITITKADIQGSFKGLLSNGEMENYIDQYEGTVTIEPLETKTIQVKASTSPFVNTIASETVNGSIVFTFETTNTQQKWVQNVPIQIDIALASSCDGKGILITGEAGTGKLETTAFQGKAQSTFQLLNVCEVDSTPYTLRNLKAKLLWKSNPYGNVELALTDIEGSQTSVEVLKSGSFATLFDEFKTAENSVYEGIMTFIPFASTVGKKAEFTIQLEAQLGNNTSSKTVKEEFDVEVIITNLESCVKFDPEPEKGIKIKSDETETTFQIDTSECGAPVDIAFCYGTNNTNCSGGAPEGKLFLQQYTITDLEEPKQITVERKGGTLPGTYDLTVDARVPGSSYQRIASIKTIIESDSTYAFDLDKSDFALYQKGAKDSSTVTSRLFTEIVKVKAGVCDWGKASKSSNFGQATIAGVAAGLGAKYVLAKSATVIAKLFTGTGWGAPIAIAVIVFIAVLSMADDPCDDDFTGDLVDYIINLKGTEMLDNLIEPDAIDVQLSSNARGDISAGWELTRANIFNDNGKIFQTAGVVLQNNTGYTNPNPLFGVMTLRAKEHIHGDASHSGGASVKCGNGKFFPYNIGGTTIEGNCSPVSNEIREERFHVKIKTQDISQALPKLEFDTVSCIAGTDIGQAGKGALPKVAFNWNWNEPNGILMDTCDSLNGNSVYCDSTQFNIMLMKRMHALDEFLEANNYDFVCPTNPNEQQRSADFPNDVPLSPGSIGLTSVGYEFLGTTNVEFRATIGNNSDTNQSTTLTVTIGNTNDEFEGVIPNPCTAMGSISAGGERELRCSITGFGISPTYYAEYTLSSDTTSTISYSNPTVYLNTESVEQQEDGTCEDLPKSTAIIGNAPAINWWIDSSDPLFGQYVNEETVTFTSSVPNVQALNQLLHFDAYLIRDGYSNDFENDFRDHYIRDAFADTPQWFKGNTPERPVFSKYYGENDLLTFSNKYFEDTTLPAPGKYRIDIEAWFGEEWRFFNDEGEPNATIDVLFNHEENPVPNSPFYRLPFDGKIGLIDTTYERIGYGMEYMNENEPIKVNDSGILTFNGDGSSALTQTSVEKNMDIRKLNSLASTRGNLLQVVVESGTENGNIILSPSLATPVMMEVTHGITEQPFSSYYQINESNTPVETGSTLTYWEGAGNCYDFTGIPVYEAFNFTPDRSATSSDAITNWQFSYGTDWERARTGGKESLRTIFYTPTNAVHTLQSNGEATMFYTSDNATPSNTILLNGISTLSYNNASSAIDSIQDVFDLVGEKKICVSNSGIKTEFFWNPQAIYNQTGSQTSITAKTNELVEGKSCLGPPLN